mgnify:CR=1 FL=1
MIASHVVSDFVVGPTMLGWLHILYTKILARHLLLGIVHKYIVSILIFILFIRLFSMLRVETNPCIWVHSYAWCWCVLYTPVFFHLCTLLTLESMYMMFIVWFLVPFLLFMWCLSWSVYHTFMWFTSLTQPHLWIEPLLFTYICLMRPTCLENKSNLIIYTNLTQAHVSPIHVAQSSRMQVTFYPCLMYVLCTPN